MRSPPADYARRMHVPENISRTWRDQPEWIAALPGLSEECAEQWGLALEEPFESGVSLVVPAGEVVLKLIAPTDVEALHEADALERWAGVGAVRLVDRDVERNAVLVERCRPGRHAWDDGNDWLAVVEGVLPRLGPDPGETHPFRSLAGESQRWAEEIVRNYESAGRPFERRLVELALDVLDSVDTTASFLVNQDLHGANILRAEREPWLVIDPKPLVGERELNGVGPLRNAAWRGGAGRCLDLLAGLGLDRERLRAWGVAHAVAWGFDPHEGWSDALLSAARTILAA